MAARVLPAVIVLDTSFLVAFHNERDVHHAAATKVMSRFLDAEWGPGLLLEYVFLEVVTVLRLRLDVTSAVEVGETLLRARELEFLPCSELFMDSFRTMRTEREAPLSFVDATILNVARRNDPGFIATFDRDFRGLDGVRVVPESS